MARAHSRPRLLVIDDDSFITDLVVDLAGAAGYEARGANTPDAIFESLGPGNDLTMLDLSLPGVDVVTVLREMFEAQPDGPVVLFTGAIDGSLEGARKVAALYGLSIIGEYAKSDGLADLGPFLEELRIRLARGDERQ